MTVLAMVPLRLVFLGSNQHLIMAIMLIKVKYGKTMPIDCVGTELKQFDSIDDLQSTRNHSERGP